MNKAKTNALDSLRALISERQQYQQWMSALEAKKEGTPGHVFERVQKDYEGRLDRVVNEIQGHSEELQLSISTLSSRLVEVAREEDTRRESLAEAELRAAVGEYEPHRWDQLKSDGEGELQKIAADRESLDSQLGELRSIQKLAEITPGAPIPEPHGANSTPVVAPVVATAQASSPEARRLQPHLEQQVPERPAPVAAAPAEAVMERNEPGEGAEEFSRRPDTRSSDGYADASDGESPPSERLPLEPVADAASAAARAASRPRSAAKPTPASGPRADVGRPDAAKTLKCPECSTPNYPTEWYCERCGGELATM
ncbi:MAG: hypothetical protein ABIS03_07000 [Gemmatimonadaceae bacterium]